VPKITAAAARPARRGSLVGAAVRKAREPNDKLDRATDNILAEADRKRKALHGLCR